MAKKLKRHEFHAGNRRQITSSRENKIVLQRSEVRLQNQAANRQRPIRTGILADQTHSGYLHNGRYIFF
jgi:hypothetical protein